MEKTILFQKGANVLTASGKYVGSLERVVLNPDTNVVTDIVIREGTLFNTENRVIPINMVAETTDDQVILHGELEELKTFPPFEERRLVDEDDITHPHVNVDVAMPPVIYGVQGTGPILVPVPEDHLTTTIEQNIPPGTVALKEGARVMTADEKHVGNVERVLADPSVNQVTHLLVTQGLLIKERKLIPMSWMKTLDEEAVYLRVNEDAVAALQSITD